MLRRIEELMTNKDRVRIAAQAAATLALCVGTVIVLMAPVISSL
jgi:hypothetical protein